MPATDALEEYFDLIERENLFASGANGLASYLDYLFARISFEGKTMLDVGGGFGLFAFFAALKGAREVVVLEPMQLGSNARIKDRFEVLRTRLRTGDRVRVLPVALQEYEPGGRTFDVVLLHNSVNHLDEEVCRRLHRSEKAAVVYRGIFEKVASLTSSGGSVIITDCSRYNLFPMLGSRNPIVPMIEWDKHQPPGLWCRLARGAGLHEPKVRWTSPNRLGRIGRVFLGNRVAAFFLTSHFCLTLKKQ